MGIASSRPASWPVYPVVQHSKRVSFWLHGAAMVAVALVLSAPDELLSSAQVNVSAVVVPRVVMRQGPAPQALRITQADIARGYVDVPESSVIWVRSNADGGFRLDVGIQADYVSRLSVRGLGPEVVVGPAGGTVFVPGRVQDERRFDLQWRLHLAGAAREGQHPWPVQLAASPL